jgi:hypothetical protein
VASNRHGELAMRMPASASGVDPVCGACVSLSAVGRALT